MLQNISNANAPQNAQKHAYPDNLRLIAAHSRLNSLVGLQGAPQQPQTSAPLQTLPPPPSSSTASVQPSNSHHRTRTIPEFIVYETEEVDDCDTPFEDDPAFSSLYATDVHDYLQSIESSPAFHPTDYFPMQPSLQPTDRDKYVNSLIEVHLILKKLETPVSQDTLFLAVNIFDRFLSKRQMAREKLPLLMIASFYLAAKFEDTNYPVMVDLLRLVRSAGSKQDMVLMERVLLHQLGFRLGAPTVYVFLRRYVHCSQCETRVGLTARFLSELSLMSYNLSIKYPPSLVAAASLSLALIINDQPPWTRTLEFYSHYKYEELRECMFELRDLLKRIPLLKYSTVFKKYSQENYLGVAASAVESI